MINSLFISKTGMEAQQTQLDVISHNLANVSTTGYKRANAVFEDLIYQNLRQVGAQTTEENQLPTGLHLGLGVRAAATSRNFLQGTLQQSNNSLDVAINGNGFFEVTQPDGTTAYTRDGSFQVNAQGQLVTASGLPVGGGITIPAGATSVSISPEGVVSALMPGNAAPQAVGNLAMSSFINPAGLEPRGQNLYIETAASGQPQQGTPGLNGLGTVQQGYLEGSNVNVVQELVTMIQTQRAYEMNSKAIQTSDQMLAKLAQL
jgi:flagellar basal-body rod protein FlgG